MMASSAAAQVNSADSDNSTVTVQVTDKIAIDIAPSALQYDSIEPGSVVTQSSGALTGQPVGVLEIENIGSQNITNIWLNATTPSDDPFGTGIASQYDAGNFIEVKRTGERYSGAPTPNGFTFVNRKEFNSSEDLSYVFTPDADWKYGRFRVGDQEHFWAVETDGAGTCSTNAGSFRVGIEAHNRTATGSTDFEDSSEYDPYSPTEVGASGIYLAPNVEINPPGMDPRTYDVLIDCGDPTYTVRTKYNVNALGLSDLTFEGGTTIHLLNATTDSEALQPGEYFGLNTSIRIPQGVASTEGTDGIDGTLRVLVNNLGL